MRSEKIVEILNEAGLEIPEDLQTLLDKGGEVDFINGVGGEGSWINCLIPKSISDISIVGPALLHDYRFYIGETLDDFLEANRLFLNDILTVLDSKGMGELRSMGDIKNSHAKAWKFYRAVDIYGMRFFRTVKNAHYVDSELRSRAKNLVKTLERKENLGTGDMY